MRVSRAAWRLEQAGREGTWALASARAELIADRPTAGAYRVTGSPGPGVTEIPSPPATWPTPPERHRGC